MDKREFNYVDHEFRKLSLPGNDGRVSLKLTTNNGETRWILVKPAQVEAIRQLIR